MLFRYRDDSYFNFNLLPFNVGTSKPMIFSLGLQDRREKIILRLDKTECFPLKVSKDQVVVMVTYFLQSKYYFINGLLTFNKLT